MTIQAVRRKSRDIITLSGTVDENGQLSAQVPASIPLGPVTVLVLPVSHEDAEARAWKAGIAHEWADELSDPKQDI
jgi:hypothetical protein